MFWPSSLVSKILFGVVLFLISYYVYMDVALYIRIHSYSIDRKNNLVDSTHSDDSAKAIYAKTGLPIREKFYEQETWVPCDINPLCHITVKAILLDHTNFYLFAPMVILFDQFFGISKFNFVTANMISFSHVGVACLAGKFVASEANLYRRIGVFLFQVRTFLDDLDGYVARTKKHIKGEHSEVGTTGYYIDGICDGLGCIALLIGIFLYLKVNPPRRGYIILPTYELKVSEHIGITKTKVTTQNVLRHVISFAGQLLLSSASWNRYIAAYQDILEPKDLSAKQSQCITTVLRSNWFFFVSWLWRILNVHALLHLVLLSIFCDKLWEFLKFIKYIGYIALLFAIFSTELHIAETRRFIFSLYTWNITNCD